ncbi:MAG: cyclic nucleotide-binding domain-containing protein [Oligoflexia bacterium]|nr:cyclic nucleotide-binding domain-containing protein [Oligoflexia bacterium]
MKEKSNQNIFFHKDQIIFTEGMELAQLYIIKKGKVQLLKESANKRLIPLANLGEREFLGMIEIFENRPTNCIAIAIEDSELSPITKTDILSVLATMPDWASKLMLTLTSRLNKAQEILAEHNIVENKLSVDDNYTPEIEAYFKNLLKSAASTQ